MIITVWCQLKRSHVITWCLTFIFLPLLVPVQYSGNFCSWLVEWMERRILVCEGSAPIMLLHPLVPMPHLPHFFYFGAPYKMRQITRDLPHFEALLAKQHSRRKNRTTEKSRTKLEKLFSRRIQCCHLQGNIFNASFQNFLVKVSGLPITAVVSQNRT